MSPSRIEALKHVAMTVAIVAGLAAVSPAETGLDNIFPEFQGIIAAVGAFITARLHALQTRKEGK